MLDVVVPGGAYVPIAHAGWKAVAGRATWKYTNAVRGPGGITRVAIEDLSRRTPGLVRFSVSASRASVSVDPTALPLAGILVLDPQTPDTSQCGAATFTGPTSRCTESARAVRCR